MMLKPDNYFKQHSHHFPTKDRATVRKLFRRAVRQYYAMQRKYVIDPVTQLPAKRIYVGAMIKKQKTQNRVVKHFFKGRYAAGRPERLEIKLLISRLFILWDNYSKTPATFAWKTSNSIQTEFEVFLNDLLPRLGAADVRRYVEKHWAERK